VKLSSTLVLILAFSSVVSRADPAYGPLKTIDIPNPSLPADCDPTFREEMAKAVKHIWTECQAVGGTEPSVCQRRIFNHCVRVARTVAKQTTNTCDAIAQAGEETRRENGRVDTQRTSYLSGELLNDKAAKKTQVYVEHLAANEAALGELERAGGAVINGSACHSSSAAELYTNVGRKVERTVSETKATISRLKKQKEANAKLLTQHVAELSKEEEAIKSLGQKAPEKALEIKPERAAARRLPLMMNVSGAGPARLMGFAPSGAPSSIQPELPDAYFERPRPASAKYFAHGGAGGGSTAPATRAASPGTPLFPPQAELDALNANELKLSAPGAVVFSSLNIRVAPAFLDRERLVIAKGIETMPKCLRSKIVNGSFKRVKQPPKYYGNMWMEEIGQASNSLRGPERYWIELDPDYHKTSKNFTGMVPSMVVHELYHVVSFADNERLLNAFAKYQAPLQGDKANCPMSPYGGVNHKEDFAEAGTMVHYPEGGIGGLNKESCVKEKVQKFKEMIGC